MFYNLVIVLPNHAPMTLHRKAIGKVMLLAMLDMGRADVVVKR